MKIIKSYIIAVVFLAFSIISYAQSPRAYYIYDADGNRVTYDKMISELSKKQVVFFGEMHNCPISHWLELEVTKSLFSVHESGMAMGAEMFEADNQLILDEFMLGIITEKSYEAGMRLWGNYATDYAMLIDFAKENALPFAATNIPRRYAQIVSEKGLSALDSLSAHAKEFIAPLPIAYEIDTTRNEMFGKMAAMMGGHGNRKNPEFMTQAQAIKDATMAWYIAQRIDKKTTCFLHFNGTFHSDRHEGIIPFLHQYKKGVSIGIISTCRQEDILQLEKVNLGRADFIICIPEDMMFSY